MRHLFEGKSYCLRISLQKQRYTSVSLTEQCHVVPNLLTPTAALAFRADDVSDNTFGPDYRKINTFSFP